MTTNIKGILPDPTNTPLPRRFIKVVATKTNSGILKGSFKVYRVSTTGSYDFQLLNGNYDLYVAWTPSTYSKVASLVISDATPNPSTLEQVISYSGSIDEPPVEGNYPTWQALYDATSLSQEIINSLVDEEGNGESLVTGISTNDDVGGVLVTSDKVMKSLDNVAKRSELVYSDETGKESVENNYEDFASVSKEGKYNQDGEVVVSRDLTEGDELNKVTSSYKLDSTSLVDTFNNGVYSSSFQVANGYSELIKNFDQFKVTMNNSGVNFGDLLEVDATTNEVTINGYLKVDPSNMPDPIEPNKPDTFTIQEQYAATPAGSWHDVFVAGQDYWYRRRSVNTSGVDGSVTYGDWSAPYLLMAQDGASGNTYIVYYEYSIDGVTDWHEVRGPDDLYVRQQIVDNGVVGPWSDPSLLRGPAGYNGYALKVKVWYANEYDPSNPTATVWHETKLPTDYWMRQDYYTVDHEGNETLIQYGEPLQIKPILGIDYFNGPAGSSVGVVRIYKQAWLLPATPYDELIYSFETNTLEGDSYGWSLTVPDYSPDAGLIYYSSAGVTGDSTEATVLPTAWETPNIYGGGAIQCYITSEDGVMFKNNLGTPKKFVAKANIDGIPYEDQGNVLYKWTANGEPVIIDSGNNIIGGLTSPTGSFRLADGTAANGVNTSTVYVDPSDVPNNSTYDLNSQITIEGL